MKKFLLGFVVGATLLSVIPVKAAVEQYLLTQATYPVIVEGFPLEDPDYPILNYQGTTYLSLRKTAEAVDADLNWNSEKGQAEITSKKNNPTKEVSSLDGKLITKTYIIKSKLFVTDSQNRTHDYVIKDGDEGVPLNMFGSCLESPYDRDNYTIEIPGKESVVIKENGVYNDNVFFVNGLTFVKLSSVGLSSRFEGDVLWLE